MPINMPYERNDEYRVKRDRFTDRDITEAVAGVIYGMAPGRNPRKMDAIMGHVVNTIHKTMMRTVPGNTFYRAFTVEEFKNYMHDMLFSCDAYKELNLSNNEYAKGIGYDDPSRTPFAVVSMYDTPNSDYVNNDFIDLDACERNIIDRAYELIDDDDDCFLCDLAHNDDGADNEVCKTCRRNPKIGDRYHHTQIPHENYHTVCSGTCDAGYYSCCTECRRKDACTIRCKYSMTDEWKDCKNLTYYETTSEDDDI